MVAWVGWLGMAAWVRAGCCGAGKTPWGRVRERRWQGFVRRRPGWGGQVREPATVAAARGPGRYVRAGGARRKQAGEHALLARPMWRLVLICSGVPL